MKAKNLSQEKILFETRNHIIVNAPPDAAPYKADTIDMKRILKNGFGLLRNSGLSFMCIQLQPPHIINEVRMK
jgi:hypothetical protein